MICHTVILTLPEGTDPEAEARLVEGLDELGKIEFAVFYEHYPGLQLRTGPVKHVIVSRFKDVELFRGYLAHEAHVRFLDNVVDPLGVTIDSVQFEASDPDS